MLYVLTLQGLPDKPRPETKHRDTLRTQRFCGLLIPWDHSKVIQFVGAQLSVRKEPTPSLPPGCVMAWFSEASISSSGRPDYMPLGVGVTVPLPETKSGHEKIIFILIFECIYIKGFTEF